jgi:hypothetical protein
VKAWHVGAAAGAGLGLFGLSRLFTRRRRGPSHWTTLGTDETDFAWTAPNVEPGTVLISGPTRIPIPPRYQRLGLAVAGVAPEMLRARVLYTPDSPVKYWLEAQPKQAGTTTLSVVDGVGPVAHVALQQEAA